MKKRPPPRGSELAAMFGHPIRCPPLEALKCLDRGDPAGLIVSSDLDDFHARANDRAEAERARRLCVSVTGGELLGGSRWRLDLGTACELMRGLEPASVDHTITDPPYSGRVEAGYTSQATIRERVALGDCSGLGIGTSDGNIRAWSQGIARVTRRWAIVFSDVESCHLWRAELELAGMVYVRTGAWDRVNGAPQFSGDRPAQGIEVCTICHAPGQRLRWNGGGSRALWRYPRPIKRTGHPTEKPAELCETLVRLFTDPGDLVCDPFSGSGAIGVAALRIGRRFVGSELDPKWYELAHRRLDRVREQVQLPIDRVRTRQAKLEL